MTTIYLATGDGLAVARPVAASLETAGRGSPAVDPAEPETIVVSAAGSPWEAHDPSVAESTIYRRSGDGPWEEVREGLPSPRGKRVAGGGANEGERRGFYATRAPEIYRSSAAGLTWE